MVAAVESMAYAGEVPWHGLGTKVSDDLSPNQIMVKAGLDWQVNKVPTYARVGGGIGMTRMIAALEKHWKD